MFQGRSSVLVVISRCVGCERQCLIAFIFKCARSKYTLHVLHSLLLPTPDASERRQTGTCRLPARCGKRRSQGSEPNLLGARVLGAGADKRKDNRGRLLDRADSSERASRQFPRQGATAAIVLRESCFRPLRSKRHESFPPFAGFAALHYCDLSYKSLQSRSVGLSSVIEHGADASPRLGRLR
jgi:hypothetical protein